MSINTNDTFFDELDDQIDKELLSPGTARLEHITQNTSEFTPRDVPAVLYPATRSDVVKIVKLAGKHSIPLYPYSTGKNWGMGSKLPVTDGCVLLDLGRLNWIREVNIEQHYAIIEPGVTQNQLSNFLKENEIPLMLNVTGSSPQSSVVGNILERGTGFHNHRIEDVRGMEVVMGNGEVLKTGFWHYGDSKRPVHHYKYGIGPSLDGLFSQSNFGVVTAIVMNLIPIPERISMLWCTFTEDILEEVMDKIGECYKQGLLRNVIHIGNDRRMKIASSKKEVPVWTAMGSITGNKNLTKFIEKEVRAALGKLCSDMLFYTEDSLPNDETIRSLFDLHSGTCSEVFIKAMYKSVGETIYDSELNLDHGRYGMLCCLPMIPLSGKHVHEAVQLVEKVCQEFNTLPAITLNPQNSDYLESVINLYFDRRDPLQIQNAHKCNIELHKRLFESGYRFYRVDIESMETITDQDSPFWKTVEAIKTALDPFGVVSPKRYNLR